MYLTMLSSIYVPNDTDRYIDIDINIYMAMIFIYI